MGLTAPRTTIGWPLEMPPSRPPALFVCRLHSPAESRPSITSMTAEPKDLVCSNPSPSSTPLTMGMLMTAPASAASRRRSQWTWLPRPIGTPVAIASKTPPAVSPAARASSMRAIIRSSAAASGQRSGLASVSSRDRVAAAGSSATPATSAVNDQTSMPSWASSARATAPAATRAAVSRAEARSSTLRTSPNPYFTAPARSAWPALRCVIGMAFLSPASAIAASSEACSSVSGSICMTRVQLTQSRFRRSSRIGDPMVRPWRTPPSISARSCSMDVLRAPRP